MNKHLSIDANAVYGAFFQLSPKMEMTFRNNKKFSCNFVNGINELVEKGYIIKRTERNGADVIFKGIPSKLNELNKVSMKFLKQNTFAVLMD